MTRARCRLPLIVLGIVVLGVCGGVVLATAALAAVHMPRAVRPVVPV
ncbi:hypothetical protein [Mycolicibacterium llatzerense]|nr:hypothetical protein [Mycolicibacterium llatzerense]